MHLLTNNNSFDISSTPFKIKQRFKEKGLIFPDVDIVDQFILGANSSLPGNWNSTLNKFSFLMGQHNTIAEDVLSFIEELAPLPLDSSDRATFYSGFTSGQKNVKSKETNAKYFRDTYEIFLQAFKAMFHIWEADNGVRQFLEEHIPRTVRYVSKEKIISRATQILKETKLFAAPAKIKAAVDSFINLSINLPELPKHVAFKSDNELAFHRLDFDPTSGPCPLFDEFCSRCTDQQSFKAFLWSVFASEADCQQYVWIYGDGQDGKGSIIRLLQKLLGNSFCAARATNINNDKHYTSHFLGKRLAVYSDADSQDFIRTGIFKELTGGDPVKIDPKNEAPYSIILKLKILICSNKKPRITSQKADQRRAIFIEVKPFSGDVESSYEDSLWKERASILYNCRESYNLLTRNNGPIRNDSKANQVLAEDAEELFDHLTSDLLRAGADNKVTKKDLYHALKDVCRDNKIEYGELKGWIMRKYQLQEDREPNNGPRIIRGISIHNPYRPPGF